MMSNTTNNTNNDTNNSNSNTQPTSSRPLLLIFDRNMDLNPPLMHSSSYQALMDDLLEHRLNRVSIEINTKNSASNTNNTNNTIKNDKKKTYDVNTYTDPFFAKYSTSSFPDAVEANEKELGMYISCICVY